MGLFFRQGLAILQTFDEHNPRLTATQAGQRCGLTRTAARRYLLTLLHLGYVMTDGKLFWLTPKVMRLGQSYLESARLPRIVQPSLQRLAMGTQEISFVAVLDGFDLVYIARNGQNRSMNSKLLPRTLLPTLSACARNSRASALKTGRCLSSNSIWPTVVSQFLCVTIKEMSKAH
jgi:DNA-binding IclR family transcriptional regulator